MAGLLSELISRMCFYAIIGVALSPFLAIVPASLRLFGQTRERTWVTACVVNSVGMMFLTWLLWTAPGMWSGTLSGRLTDTAQLLFAQLMSALSAVIGTSIAVAIMFDATSVERSN